MLRFDGRKSKDVRIITNIFDGGHRAQQCPTISSILRHARVPILQFPNNSDFSRGKIIIREEKDLKRRGF